MNDATPLNNIHVHYMIPEDQKNMTESTEQPFNYMRVLGLRPHIFVWIWGSNMAAFPVMVPDFFVL